MRRQYRVQSLPPDLHANGKAEFDGRIAYLGNVLDSNVAVPGGAIRITHYWQVLKPLDDGWSVFSQVLGGDAANWMNIDSSPMRAVYPTQKWRQGDILRDPQTFALKRDWSENTATIVVGVRRPDGTRLQLSDGNGDASSRASVAQVKVDSPASGYRIRRADQPITVDGLANEAAWRSAPMSPPFTDAEGGRPVGFGTVAQLLWDDENLYLFARIEDTDVFSQYQGRDDPLWKEDVLEVFIDADRNRRGYVELQVNPNNAHFDAWFKGTRANGGAFDWNSTMRSAVQVHGSATQRADVDRGWDLELAIPLADARGADSAMKINVPPLVGDTWRLNVIRVDKPQNEGLAASSWNPIPIADFHALGRMLEVVFADSEGATTRADVPQELPVLP